MLVIGILATIESLHKLLAINYDVIIDLRSLLIIISL